MVLPIVTLEKEWRERGMGGEEEEWEEDGREWLKEGNEGKEGKKKGNKDMNEAAKAGRIA